jgi:hypothetical protein
MRRDYRAQGPPSSPPATRCPAERNPLESAGGPCAPNPKEKRAPRESARPSACGVDRGVDQIWKTQMLPMLVVWP